MELRQLRYFVAAAEAGNIGAAARKLHVSQPPVTRQIQKLEAEIGCALLLRTPKGVELTAAGKTFLGEARSILAHTDRAVSRSRLAHDGAIGELDIAFTGSPIYITIPKILRNFRARAPRVSIALHRLGKQEQIDALRDGRLHVGFGRFYPDEPDLVTQVVELDAPALAVAANAPFVGESIRLRELTNEPLILFPAAGRPNFADLVVALFKKAKITPHVAHIAEDLAAALALTAADMGRCVVPASVAELDWPGIRFLRIEQAKPTIPVHCIYRAHTPSPLLNAFLDALTDYQQKRDRR